MAGIYCHIPFCKRACHYCNFYFSTSVGAKNDIVAALLKEMTIQRDYLEGEIVDTVYFGGGTPSILPAGQLSEILAAARTVFHVSQHAEITLECNPDDVHSQSLNAWNEIGINRLSLGLQSFFDDDLRWMNRSHSANQALESIRVVRAHGFDNFSVDLIYGFQLLTQSKWKENVMKVLELGIPHVSCYGMTIEPNTALARLIARGAAEDIDQSVQAEQFLLLMKWMKDAGFEHYEISNFAMPGFRSRHNSSYWQGKKYLGLGPSAHSYNGKTRQWNVSNNSLYTSGLRNGILNFESENLSPTQRINEYIMTSLRTIEGCELDVISNNFGDAIAAILEKATRKYIPDSLVRIGSRLVLNDQGKLFADDIASSLFFETLA